MLENTSKTRAQLSAEQVLRENNWRPIGYQPPSGFSTVGAVVCGMILVLVFGLIALGLIQAPIPDYLVHPAIDGSTDPLIRIAAWFGGW